MTNLSVLPADPLKKKTLLEWLGLDSPDALQDLVDKGWLIEPKEQFLSVYLHPVMAETARRQLEPDVDTCRVLVKSLARELKGKKQKVL